VAASAGTAIQVYYAGDTAGQVFPSSGDHGNAGTHLAAGGRLYGPNATAYTEVSQSAVAGNGSAGGPPLAETFPAAAPCGARAASAPGW
jgi:hypothetical protein